VEAVTRVPSLTRAVTGHAGLHWLTQIGQTLAGTWEAAPGIPGDDRLMFEVAIFEVAGNMVEHSIPTPTWFWFEIDVNSQRLAAVLRDNAGRTTVQVDAARMPDEMAEGGRGLALAKSALDILQHDAAEGNRWTLVRLLA
jgi:serine/threonine-protein kinase RsbW